MSRARLFPQESPSPLRIGSGSLVLAAHLAALLAMSLAMPEQEARPQRVVPAAIQVDIVPAAPVLDAPPPPPMPSAPSRPVAQPQPQPLPLQQEPVFTTPAVAAPGETVALDLPPAGVGDGVADPEPGGRAGLAVLQSPPPPYPARARRMGWQGEVWLRIHVGADGRPREVSVTRGSGHAELDRAARRHVAEHWRFAAPMHRGHAVEAWAEVPIHFSLQ